MPRFVNGAARNRNFYVAGCDVLFMFAAVQSDVKPQEFQPEHFLNRELSWLEFNQRVLDEALDPTNPLLERLKFFTIVSSNLDEFFEVRVARLKQEVESGQTQRGLDGRTPSETLRAVIRRVRQLVADQYACWREELQPALLSARIRIWKLAEVSRGDQTWLETYYREQVRPVLTPLAIDPAHPFPQLLNKSLNLIVRLELKKGRETLKHMAVVQMPAILPRLVPLPRQDGRHDYVYSATWSGTFSRISFRVRPFWAGGRSGSPATASCTLTTRRKATC